MKTGKPRGTETRAGEIRGGKPRRGVTRPKAQRPPVSGFQRRRFHVARRSLGDGHFLAADLAEAGKVGGEGPAVPAAGPPEVAVERAANRAPAVLGLPRA